MPSTTLVPSDIPTESEAQLARETKKLLAVLLKTTSSRDSEPNAAAPHQAIRLPRSAIRLLAQILDEMSRGNAVKVIPVRAELTTQEAADLLHVSRPTLIQMLESGALPFRKVGTHRRIRVDALMANKRKVDVERKTALDELSAYDQEIGL